jgi:hypothetical protein
MADVSLTGRTSSAMAWDDIRIGLLITYSILTTDFLVLDGSSLPSNLQFPPNTKSSSPRSEIDSQKTHFIDNCTYRWPEVSTTIVLPLNFQSEITKTIRDIVKERQLSRSVLEKDIVTCIGDYRRGMDW